MSLQGHFHVPPEIFACLSVCPSKDTCMSLQRHLNASPGTLKYSSRDTCMSLQEHLNVPPGPFPCPSRDICMSLCMSLQGHLHVPPGTLTCPLLTLTFSFRNTHLSLEEHLCVPWGTLACLSLRFRKSGCSSRDTYVSSEQHGKLLSVQLQYIC